MQRPRGFTVIELIIAVSVLGVLAALVMVNGSSARMRSRDANRRAAVDSYHTSLEQYKAKKGTYFVTSGGACSVVGTQTLNQVPTYMQGSGDGCTGLYLGGSGRLTRVKGDTTNPYYASQSIAQALVNEGVLSQIAPDPLDKARAYTDESERDYILTLCDSSGKPALTPETTTEFAVYMAAEAQPREVEESTSKQLCGGPNTANGWDYWLAQGDAATQRTLANAEVATNDSSQVQLAAASLPRPEIGDLSVRYDANTSSITGGFTAENTTSAPLSPMFYTATLLYAPATGEQQELQSEIVTELYPLQPGASRTNTFSMTVPKGLEKGSFYVVIRAQNQTGVTLAMQAAAITLPPGSASWLRVIGSESKVVFGDTSYPALAARTAPYQQRPVLRFTVHNDHTKDLQGALKISLYKRAILPGETALKEVTQEQKTYAAGSSEVVELTMPNTLEPESYLVRLQLIDAEGQPVSAYQEFRWVVAGESGKVVGTTVSASQAFFQTEVTVDSSIVGPADGGVVTEAVLTIEVFRTGDSSQKVLATSREVLPAISPKLVQQRANLRFKTGLVPLEALTVRSILRSSSGVELQRVEASYPVTLNRDIPLLYWLVPSSAVLLLLLIWLVIHRRRALHYMRPVALVLVPLFLLGAIPPQALAIPAAMPMCVVSTQDQNAGICQTVWNAGAIPTTTYEVSYSTTNPVAGADVVVTAFIQPDLVNNAMVTADFHAAQNQVGGTDCLDAVVLDAQNVMTGTWVQTVTAGAAGSTDLKVDVTTSAETSCWTTCNSAASQTTTLTCSEGGGNNGGNTGGDTGGTGGGTGGGTTGGDTGNNGGNGGNGGGTGNSGNAPGKFWIGTGSGLLSN